MHYAIFANTTAIVHALIIAAVIVGLLISFRYRRFRPWEAGALVVIVILWSYYGNCPLTILEQWLREQAGEPANLTSIGFLPFYANKFLAISVSSSIVQRSTFFTGGAIFTASIEWLSPFFHWHVFSVRKTFRKIFGLKKQKRRYA